jgi:serine/threonine protein kinase
LLDALIYLHERDRQIIHRDIKPHNLKLMPNGRVALLDFGLAKRTDRINQ